MKNFTKLLLLLIIAVSSTIVSNAQVSGNVFIDVNNDGVKNPTGAPYEAGKSGIVVNAYNAAGTLAGTATTNASGNYTIASISGAHRIEFATGPMALSKRTGANNSNVQFVTAPATNINLAIAYKGGVYMANGNPKIVVNASLAGNPIGGGNVGTEKGIFILNGSLNNGNGANGGDGDVGPDGTNYDFSHMGATFGLAIQRETKTAFAAAYLKRHVGFGAGGMDAIYKMTIDASGNLTAAPTQLLKLGNIGINVGTNPRVDVLPATHATGTPSTTVSVDDEVFPLIGRIGIGSITISDDGRDLYVVNMHEKKLHRINIGNPVKASFTAADVTANWVIPTPSGGVPSGGGYFPMAVKYYEGKVYVGVVTSKMRTDAPQKNFTDIVNDHVGLRGYVYEVNISTGVFTEVLNFPLSHRRSYILGNSASTTTGFEYQFKNNYWRAWQNNSDENILRNDFNNTAANGTFPALSAINTRMYYPQPIIADLDFDVDGEMILGVRDRFGDQMGFNQPLTGTLGGNNFSGQRFRALTMGEVLRAGKSGSTFTLETNAGVTHNGTAQSSASVQPVNHPVDSTGNYNNTGTPWGDPQGPGGKYYYWNPAYIATGVPTAELPGGSVGLYDTHFEKTVGGLTVLPGYDKLINSTVDPDGQANSSGLLTFSNKGLIAGSQAGNMVDQIELFASGSSTNTDPIFGGKGNAMGDVEPFLQPSTIEIGNRLWLDADYDGIQDAGETGISGATVTLRSPGVDGIYGNGDDQSWTTTTDASGNYYFGAADGNVNDNRRPASWTGFASGNTGILNGYDYRLEILQSAVQLSGYTITTLDASSNSVDNIDNDGTLGRPVGAAANIYYASVNTKIYNYDYDFGFRPLASLGDKVWKDDDKDGIQDAGEPGVAGVTVTLYQNGTDGLAGTSDDMIIGTTVTDAYGNYLFNNLVPSTNNATQYSVGFTPPANYQFTTQTNTQTTGTDNATNVTNTSGGSTAANGSDANATTGRTGSFWLTNGENELGVDAGIIFTQPTTNSIGDRVWFDNGFGGGTAGDGIQNGTEPGVSGVTVTIYNNAGVVVATTVTDANGNYIFTGLADGNYRVGFTLPAGMNFTTKGSDNTSGGAGDSNTDSDVNTASGINFGKTDVIDLDAASAIAAGVNYTNVDAGLIQAGSSTSSLGDKVWNDIDADGVQEAGEPGVAGVTVNLYRDSNGDGVISGSEASTPYATTVTDAFGNYIFNNLAASSGAVGFYQVGFVSPSGYTLTTANAGGDETKDSDANTGTGLTGNYFLKAGERNLTADAGLTQNSPAGTARLGDKVWYDADSDGVQDAGEAGVAGVTVTLYNSGGTAIATTTTDASGNYQFVNLAAGDYSVGFSNLPQGYSLTPVWSSNDANATNSDANPATGRTGTINLTAGESEQDVDAGLVAGVPSGLGSLGNKVWWDVVTNNNVQDAGEPGVPGVTVNLYRDANGDGLINGGEATTPFVTTITNALGEYIFPGLAAGTYQVGFSNLPTGSNTVTQNSGANDAIDSDGSTVTNATGTSVSTTGLYTLVTGEENLTVDLGIINTARGAFGNRVWFDNGAGGGIANDGIQNGGETGVAGVMVTLVNAAGQPVDRDGNVLVAGASLITTTTDVNGFYTFADLLAGTSFAVRFSNLPAGFSFTSKAGTGSGDDNRSDADLASGLTPALSIVANTLNTTLDGGITSTRAGLGNYVWIDDDGDGVQDSNEPGVAGVTVTLYRPGFGLDGVAGNGDDALPVASMITDQNGQYLFTNLVAGTYQVEFSSIPGGTTFTQRNTPGDNGDNTNSDAVPQAGNPSVGRTDNIVLSAGEMDLTVDAGLFKPRAVIGNYVWIDSDNDGIQDASELPASGILVSLIDGGGNVVAVAVTDANGNYLFPNVAPGTYSMSFANLPTGTSFTTANQTGGGGNNDNDSDVVGTTITGIVVTTTTVNLSFDAGLVGFIALPAQLEFTAVKQGNAAKLSWKVTFEENVARYELEHSIDGVSYISISSQNRNGSTEYQYLDARPASGINYYRVRIVDISGRITYSEIRTVLFGKGGQLLVFPNPVRTGGKVNIQLPESWQNKKITIEVMNQLGQVISTQRNQQASQVETVDASRLSEGSYLLRMSGGNGEVETRKIIVSRK